MSSVLNQFTAILDVFGEFFNVIWDSLTGSYIGWLVIAVFILPVAFYLIYRIVKLVIDYA